MGRESKTRFAPVRTNFLSTAMRHYTSSPRRSGAMFRWPQAQKVRKSLGMVSNDESVVAETRKWVKSEVIGLNLCPFAREVYVAERIRYVVSAADNAEALR